MDRLQSLENRSYVKMLCVLYQYFNKAQLVWHWYRAEILKHVAKILYIVRVLRGMSRPPVHQIKHLFGALTGGKSPCRRGWGRIGSKCSRCRAVGVCGVRRGRGGVAGHADSPSVQRHASSSQNGSANTIPLLRLAKTLFLKLKTIGLQTLQTKNSLLCG